MTVGAVASECSMSKSLECTDGEALRASHSAIQDVDAILSLDDPQRARDAENERYEPVFSSRGWACPHCIYDRGLGYDGTPVEELHCYCADGVEQRGVEGFPEVIDRGPLTPKARKISELRGSW